MRTMLSLDAGPLETRPQRDVYTISRLNREVRMRIEGGFPLLWVEGEISNLSRPGSGHLYLTLKDPQAQVRCAMFRARNRNLAFVPRDGMQVLVRARAGLYEARGDFQLVVEHMETAGDGALRRAFEVLKRRLAAEGLFAEAHKRPLPTPPRRIGVITSPTGAAIRDILSVLRRRFPAIPVLIYPVPVQGEGAPREIAAALELASERAECDVLILTRGGGSLEDLWAFNEEIVVRALHACAIPVVTGIGHEIDFTIADFVADRRAPTPSGAAEVVSPDQAEWLARLEHQGARLVRAAAAALARRNERLDALARRLRTQDPGRRLRQRAQRLDDLDLRLRGALRGELRGRRSTLAEFAARLEHHFPLARVQQLAGHCSHLDHRLHTALHTAIATRTQRLAALGRALDAVSPLATLGRGYAIVRRLPDGTLLREAAQVRIGARVEARLAHGRLVCRVEDIESPADPT
ncbi:exodeoxyribonuclease 7 large subunit [bacterium BMS3Bbin12]|nr:exodeoxyribonuclease 7 large subunit [bacterium BMS3Abin12]GBE47750.1 exodeoxyribonuclease 7 large subunit [bacterium BMS3Bbin12]GBE49860.1 exodeoxyribonuclease 7 large subunit [bacterium BMS3Bbin13]